MRVLEAMFFTPHGIRCFAFLADPCPRILKQEPDLDVRSLLFDEEMLVPVLDKEASFCFKVRSIREQEIRRVLRGSSRDHIVDLVFLEDHRDACAFQLKGNLFFEAGPVAMRECTATG